MNVKTFATMTCVPIASSSSLLDHFETPKGYFLATVLFAWELGGGIGHLAPHRELLSALITRGHSIHVVARDLAVAERVFRDLPIRYWQAPFAQRMPERLIQPTLSMCHILHNVGFSNADELASRVATWRNLMVAIQPELLMVDYSPTALAAARDGRIARAILGMGFCIPPRQTPLPVFSTLAHLVTDPSQLARDEAILVLTINAALRQLGLPLLGSLADLFHQVEAQLLFTIPELDHYPGRQNADYWGLPTERPGTPVDWPASDRRRVFAYLKPYASIEVLLELLNSLQLPTMIACDGLSSDLRERFASPLLSFAPPTVDLTQMARDCHFAITNGNHTTTGHFLMAGKPLMMIPLHLEQELVAERVKRIGAGVVVDPKSPRDVFVQLTPLLNDERLRLAAAKVAAKYSTVDPNRLGRMIARLESLC